MSRKRNMIYCNCCGRPICLREQKDKTSFLRIKKEWGYFSNGKDGKLYSVDICEPCCETLVKSFAIPPEIDQVTEYV